MYFRGIGGCLAVMSCVVFSAKGPAWAMKLTSTGQFSGVDPVITFETNSTALPGIPGLHISGGDSTFETTGFGKQVFGNFNNSTYLDISFDNPVQSVGAYIVNDDTPSTTNGVTELVYDQANNLLESESANFILTKPPAFFGIGLAGDQIYRVEWQYFSPIYFGVDNVVYGDASIPLPEPMMATMLAAAAVPLFMRRVRKAV
jgi:hypothetical protein